MRTSSPYSKFAANLGAILLLLYPDLLLAEADGPDYWRVRDLAKDDVLNIRSSASFTAPKIAEIPFDADCIKNMGCKGGLTYQEFTTLSEPEKKQVLRQRPRWCLINYRGAVGWVAGRNLQEGACHDEVMQRDIASAHDIDPRNHSYLVEKEKVTLRDGYARKMVPGTTAVIISEIIDRPVYADLTGDGSKEAVTVVIQRTAGTGTFYYLVVAARDRLIESYFLGDRINIVSVEVVEDMIKVEYLDRTIMQPMATKPSVRERMDFKLLGDRLVLSGEL